VEGGNPRLDEDIRTLRALFVTRLSCGKLPPELFYDNRVILFTPLCGVIASPIQPTGGLTYYGLTAFLSIDYTHRNKYLGTP
jgi:hypothetical protein